MIEEHSLDIERTPAQVYAFLVDQDSWATLDPALREISPRGPVSKGTTGTMKRRVSGRDITNGWVVTGLDPDVRLGMRITGPGYELSETTTLVATGQGTRATIVDVLEPTSTPGRLFVAVSGPFIRRDLRARAARLKATIEALPAT